MASTATGFGEVHAQEQVRRPAGRLAACRAGGCHGLAPRQPRLQPVGVALREPSRPHCTHRCHCTLPPHRHAGGPHPQGPGPRLLSAEHAQRSAALSSAQHACLLHPAALGSAQQPRLWPQRPVLQRRAAPGCHVTAPARNQPAPNLSPGSAPQPRPPAPAPRGRAAAGRQPRALKHPHDDTHATPFQLARPLLPSAPRSAHPACPPRLLSRPLGFAARRRCRPFFRPRHLPAL